MPGFDSPIGLATNKFLGEKLLKTLIKSIIGVMVLTLALLPAPAKAVDDGLKTASWSYPNGMTAAVWYDQSVDPNGPDSINPTQYVVGNVPAGRKIGVTVRSETNAFEWYSVDSLNHGQANAAGGTTVFAVDSGLYVKLGNYQGGPRTTFEVTLFAEDGVTPEVTYRRGILDNTGSDVPPFYRPVLPDFVVDFSKFNK